MIPRLYVMLVFLSIVSVLGCQTSSQKQRGAGSESYSTRTSSGAVMFELTPKGIENGRFVVDVRANTHSGDLSELDLKQAVALHVAGKELRPVDAASLQGHHSSGAIAFELPEAPEHFEITISGVRGMDVQRYKWP